MNVATHLATHFDRQTQSRAIGRVDPRAEIDQKITTNATPVFLDRPRQTLCGLLATATNHRLEFVRAEARNDVPLDLLIFEAIEVETPRQVYPITAHTTRPTNKV